MLKTNKQTNQYDKMIHILNIIKFIVFIYIKLFYLIENKYDNFKVTRTLEFTIKKNNNFRKYYNRYCLKDIDLEIASEDDYFLDEISEDEDLDIITNRHNCFIFK